MPDADPVPASASASALVPGRRSTPRSVDPAFPGDDHEDFAALLARALDGADPGAWNVFDRHVRDALRYRRVPPAHTWFPSFHGGRPERPVGLLELAVALCGPDGRVREAALRYVPRFPALLPLVVVRCSDWAGPVRERARAVLREELPGAGPEPLGTLVAVALGAGSRLRGDAARELLTGTLRDAPAARLTALLPSGHRTVRRLAHRIAVDRGLLSPSVLAATAATGSDVVVQDLCADALLATVTGPSDRTLLVPLLRARYHRVRAAGVTALYRSGAAADAGAFLSDRSPLVRACARWVLREAGAGPLPASGG
ncbi:hypothetical protein [Streptomyces sp. NPDC088557]|uniref:hypothetical protein n=1 Tax=Streptomyces sp. NPDC088557 TaxID=3365867 RepID=UPI0038200D7E